MSKVLSYSSRLLYVLVPLAILLFMPSRANAFWLLGFCDATTLPPGTFGASAGTGGVLVKLGSPTKTTFTPFLPNVGFRAGVTDNFDVGYRLCQVALPFSSAGPTLGSEIDGRYRLTAPRSPWQVAVVGGIAYSYLEISNVSKSAWSPGADLIVSRQVTPKYTFISELRYLDTYIPTASGGSSSSHLQATGFDLGTKIRLAPQVNLIPEVGVFDYSGELLGKYADGIAMQYGACLSFRFR